MIELPDLDAEIEWVIPGTPAQRSASGWTGRAKIVEQPGLAAWRATVRFEDIATEIEERRLRAFVAALDGMIGIARLPLPCQSPVGSAPKVATAGKGRTLALKGMQPNTRHLDAGQYLTIPLPSGHHRTVILSADLVADASGNGVASFGPPIDETVAVDTVVETGEPFVPMRMTDPDTALAASNGVTAASIDFVEAL